MHLTFGVQNSWQACASHTHIGSFAVTRASVIRTRGNRGTCVKRVRESILLFLFLFFFFLVRVRVSVRVFVRVCGLLRVRIRVSVDVVVVCSSSM